MTDTDLATASGDLPAAFTPTPHVDPTQAVADIMDLDQMLADVKLPEGTARFCLRGDLIAEWESAVADLERYVNDDGDAITPDTSLADGDPAMVAAQRVADIETEMNGAMAAIRFQAMPKGEWSEFCKRKGHIDSATDQFTDLFNVRLIARCAIEPKISEAKATALKDKLHAAAFDTIRNKAFSLNRFEGVAVPKSSSSSALLKAQESSEI